MNREPIHIEQDPSLRSEYVAQESLDEFAERVIEHAIDIDPELTDLRNKKASFVEFIHTQWAGTLSPNTTVNEYYYLAGMTDIAEREAAMAEYEIKTRQAINKVAKNN